MPKKVEIDLKLTNSTIGLIPDYIWETKVRQDRILEITKAMQRKINNEENVPMCWLEEMISHITIVENLRPD